MSNRSGQVAMEHNYWNKLYKGKFIGSLDSNEVKSHRRIKSKKLSNGNVFNPYYSGCSFENSCVLTGFCYDHSILDPIYELIQYPEYKRDYFSYMDLETLFNDCFEKLEKDLDEEVQYRNSDEFIIEEIEANEYQFLASGKVFNQ